MQVTAKAQRTQNKGRKSLILLVLYSLISRFPDHWLLWCYPYHQTVYVLRDPDLTAQTAIRLYVECLIEHVQFGVLLLMEMVIALHIYLTGGA